MGYILRQITPAVQRASLYFPVIVITGARQTGKTTLCNNVFGDYQKYNLEDVALRQAIKEDPKGFLGNCGDKIVIDEVQHIPDLLSYIQIEVDNNRNRRFVLTGSSNFTLLEKVTQSLAGRAALFTLMPFALDELGSYKEKGTDMLLVNGFYPGVVANGIPSDLFYKNYYSTYVERDLRQIKEISNLDAFQKFAQLLAGRVGCEFNASALSAEVGVTSPTIKSWFGILKTSYIAFSLQPYYANIAKRLSKMPKVYFYDTGLLCFLLGINTPEQLAQHPLRGSIFENLVVIEMLKSCMNNDLQPNLYFYRENSGREVDILQDFGNAYNIYEIKSSATFNTDFTRNLKYLRTLMGEKIRRSAVIYDGHTMAPQAYNFRNLAAACD